MRMSGARFDELRELCIAAGDKASLAIAMAGLVMDHAYQARLREASQLASEAMAFIETLGDPTLTVGLSIAPIYAKGECAEWSDVLRWSERLIDLADGDPTMGNLFIGSPLAVAFAMRAQARYCFGLPGWREDLRQSLTMARNADPMSYASAAGYVYGAGIPAGVLAVEDQAMREIEDGLQNAERSSDDLALTLSKMTLGLALVHRDSDAERDRGQQILAEAREVLVSQGAQPGRVTGRRVFTWRVKRHGVGTAITRYPSYVPPPTRCSATDGYGGGAFPRRVFWWRHFLTADPE